MFRRNNIAKMRDSEWRPTSKPAINSSLTMALRPVKVSSNDSDEDDSNGNDDASPQIDDSNDGDDINDGEDRVLPDKGGNLYESLCLRTRQSCNFCNAKFTSRYSLLKHNVKHIIIPVFKHETHKCEQCLKLFTSSQNLAAHISTEHKDILIKNDNEVKLKPNNNLKDNFKEKELSKADILKSIVKKQLVVRCDGELNNVLNKHNVMKSRNAITQGNIALDNIEMQLKNKNGFAQDNIALDNIEMQLKNKNCITQDNITLENIENMQLKNKNCIAQDNIGLDNIEMQLKNKNCITQDNIALDNIEMQLKNKNCITQDNIALDNIEMQLKNKNAQFIAIDIEDVPSIAVEVKVERSSPDFLKERASGNSEDKESIRHRLLFEEDLEDTLFNDISADYNVSIETLCKEITLDFDDDTVPEPQELINSTNKNDNEIIYDNFKIQEDTTDFIRNGKAIHYDILMAPEVCKCRLCMKNFPNRFQLLQHESQHLKLRQRWHAPFCAYCERYIAGNYRTLRAHVDRKHPSTVNWEWAVFKCPKCHLKYSNFEKHTKLCHESYKCMQCNRGFETETLRNAHICTPTENEPLTESQTELRFHLRNTQTKISRRFQDGYGPLVRESVMLLCQLCYSFMKIYMKKRQNYEVVGSKSEVGVQQTCDKCNVKVFEVIVVARRKLLSKHNDKEIGKSRRHVTNEMRLKNIQNRLKMIKKINKC